MEKTSKQKKLIMEKAVTKLHIETELHPYANQHLWTTTTL